MAAPHAPVPLEAVSPTPRSKIRARMVASSSAVNHETLVRCGNCGSVSIGGPMAARSSASSVAGSAMWIAVCGLPMTRCWKWKPWASPACAQRRAAHVHAAGRVGEDRRADLAGRGLDRELARVGPAGAAQVEDRLARAVAAQLGLGAVGVEDPQARDEAGLVGRREDEHAVGADAGVAVAQRAHEVGARLAAVELRRLDDHVVVGQRLPLLEAHRGQPSAGSPSMLTAFFSAT